MTVVLIECRRCCGGDRASRATIGRDTVTDEVVAIDDVAALTTLTISPAMNPSGDGP